YLDDQEFTASLVRRRSQGRGHALIAQELRAKGIEDLDAVAALADVEPEGERALNLGRALLARKQPANPDELRAIVGPRLSRRGPSMPTFGSAAAAASAISFPRRNGKSCCRMPRPR